MPKPRLKPEPTTIRSTMEKHRACYWLIKIADEYVEELKRFRETRKKPGERTTLDVVDGARVQRPMTESEIKEHEEWDTKQIDELELKLIALDVAARSLTR